MGQGQGLAVVTQPPLPGIETLLVNFSSPLVPRVVVMPLGVPAWLRVAPPVVPASLITRSVVSPGPE